MIDDVPPLPDIPPPAPPVERPPAPALVVPPPLPPELPPAWPAAPPLAPPEEPPEAAPPAECPPLSPVLLLSPPEPPAFEPPVRRPALPPDPALELPPLLHETVTETSKDTSAMGVVHGTSQHRCFFMSAQAAIAIVGVQLELVAQALDPPSANKPRQRSAPPAQASRVIRWRFRRCRTSSPRSRPPGGCRCRPPPRLRHPFRGLRPRSSRRRSRCCHRRRTIRKRLLQQRRPWRPTSFPQYRPLQRHRCQPLFRCCPPRRPHP